MKILLTVVLVSILSAGCEDSDPISDGAVLGPTIESTVTVVSVTDVDWEQLNPARGDKSPAAGTLWGDRRGAVPTGFLARFVDGFSSPPHIHNATYRAVVISGLIHNDDPDAAEMWMPPGSFWTQPRGEAHITAARGVSSVALVEIDKGPYLVLPPGQAFDSGERPINIDASNLVWVDLPGTPDSANRPRLAYLWGNLQQGQPNGTFVKLPAGFRGNIHSHGASFRAVVIKGELQYQGVDTQTLAPGSYFGSEGEAIHQVLSQTGEESVIYVHTDGRYDVTR